LKIVIVSSEYLILTAVYMKKGECITGNLIKSMRIQEKGGTIIEIHELNNNLFNFISQ